MKHVSLSLIFLLVLFLISHYIFEPTYLYHELVWLDIPMHVLGGLGVGLLFISLAELKHKRLPPSLLIFLFMFVAVSWEIYEYERGVMVYDGLYKYLDTVKDLVMGSIGMYGAYKLKLNKPKN